MSASGTVSVAVLDRSTTKMAKDEDPDDLDLPDKDAAKGFYAKYEPKEILGRYGKGDREAVVHCYLGRVRGIFY